MSESNAFAIPEFNLAATALDITSEEDLQAELAKEGRRGFEPGVYKLKTSSARFHLNKVTKSPLCVKDPTWFNIALTVTSSDERKKDLFIQVPTSKIKYGDKGTLFVFKKFCEFMASIGVAVNLQNLSKIAAKYFQNEETLKNLNDLEIEIEMAYEGSYADKQPDGESFKIRTKKGEALQEDGVDVTCPDFDSAKVYAQSRGIELSYCEVKKMVPQVKPQADKSAGWDK